MLSQILVFISVISISIANLYQRIAMKEESSDAYAGAILFQFILAILTGIFALYKGFNIPPVTLTGYFIVSTILYGLGTLAYFKSIKLIEASESIILGSIGSIITVITAFIFLGERLNSQQLVGVILILLSMVAISLKKKINFNRGTIYSLIGTTLYGLAVTNDVYLLQSYDAISYVPIMSFLPGLFLLSLKPSAIKSILMTIKQPSIRPLMLYCFFYGIQAVTYYVAIESGALVSQMTLISKAQIFLTVILAAIFLGETDNLKKKIFSTLLATIGVYLLL